MKKTLKHFVFVAFLMFILSACAQSSDCSRKDVFCAGLVTDVLGINDHGINQDTWAGLQKAKTNGDVDQVDYIESIDTRDYEKNIAYFAEHGYDVIITNGVGMRDETLRSADLYPDSAFVGMNQPQEETRSNLIPVTFAEDQMGFAAGVLAARISKTKSIGAVCETSGLDSIWRYCEGFRAGAKFTDKTIKVQVIYNENGDREKLFINEAWGFDTAQKLIERGVDVIFAAGGATGQGALQAVIENPALTRAIGTERDQAAALGPSANIRVVTSILGSASSEVQKVIRLLKGDNAYEAGSSQIRYVPLNPKFPESLTQEMDTLLFSLQIGEIKTDVAPQKP